MWTIEYNHQYCNWQLISPLGVVVKRCPSKRGAEDYLDKHFPPALPLRCFDEEIDWDDGAVCLRLRVYFTGEGEAIRLRRVHVTGLLNYGRGGQVFANVASCDRDRYESEFMRWLDADDDANDHWCGLALEYLESGMTEDV